MAIETRCSESTATGETLFMALGSRADLRRGDAQIPGRRRETPMAEQPLNGADRCRLQGDGPRRRASYAAYGIGGMLWFTAPTTMRAAGC
jgi:hypothetical protein